MVYQINSSRLFLTYPQCTLSKEEAYDYLENLFKPEEILVAHELHASGDDHLHCYLRLSSPIRTRDPRFADLPGPFHGNYQGCRSAKRVLVYCTKGDNYRSNFDVAPLVEKRSKRKELMGELLLGKRTLVELVEENPEYLHGYSRLRNDYLTFVRDKGDSRPSLPTFLPNPWGLVLPTKILSKLRHFWIYSDKPNLGKTYHFARPLTEYAVAHLSGPQVYFDLSGNEQAIIFDEYNHATFKYHELNAMADGTYRFRLFMGGQIFIKDFIVIILSNCSISTLYPHMYELIKARFKEIKLD
ncbi:MAG: Rep catalytic domain protein [Cressdnaviricota sp.]|nr:MAG: Rep catalytic domain protein [Cressdnaviricota sp.]